MDYAVAYGGPRNGFVRWVGTLLCGACSAGGSAAFASSSGAGADAKRGISTRPRMRLQKAQGVASSAGSVSWLAWRPSAKDRAGWGSCTWWWCDFAQQARVSSASLSDTHTVGSAALHTANNRNVSANWFTQRTHAGS